MAKRLYHVTKTRNVPSILKKGLRGKMHYGLTPAPGQKYRNRIFFFKDFRTAEGYVEDEAEGGLPYSVSILEIKLRPGTKIHSDKYMPDPESGEDVSSYITGTISPNQIKEISRYKKNWSAEDDGWYENEPDKASPEFRHLPYFLKSVGKLPKVND